MRQQAKQSTTQNIMKQNKTNTYQHTSRINETEHRLKKNTNYIDNTTVN